MNRMAPPSLRYGRTPSFRGTIRPTPARLLVLVKIRPRFGSNETPPQSPPPMLPGISTVGVVPKGVKGPLLCSVANQSPQYFSASGERLLSCVAFKLIGARGGGFTGNGSVGEYHSPGTS